MPKPEDKITEEVAVSSKISAFLAGEQPRAISSTDAQAVQPYFRASMHTELQKFGRTEEEMQLLLGEDIDILDAQTTGLDLSIPEDRALHAIQKLLDKTGYQGNMPGDDISSSLYKYRGYLPRLSMTYSEYYEAYGLQPAADGGYRGGERQQALEALRGLASSRMMTYSKRTGFRKDKGAIYEAVRVTAPLVELAEGFQDLSQEELDRVEAGQEMPEKRQTKIVLIPSPILIDMIETFYALMPSSLHDEILELRGGRRPARAISLFIELLTTYDKPVIKISREKLSYRLRLEGYIRQRKQHMIDKRIQEALDYALELEYLLDYEEKPTGLLILKLNPERCQRIGAKAKRKKTDKETG